MLDIRPSRNRRRGTWPDRRRALVLLASCPDGCPEAVMGAHGFPVAFLVELVTEGLATAHVNRVVSGGRTRLKITEAGWQTLLSAVSNRLRCRQSPAHMFFLGHTSADKAK